MKYMGLDNLVNRFSNQLPILTTFIEKETISKNIIAYMLDLASLNRFKKCLTLYIVIYYLYKYINMKSGT